MTSGFKWYPGKREKLERDVRTALEKAGEAVKTDLIQSQTVPRDTGELQESIYVDTKKSAQGSVTVVTNTPYARRLYFHPEYNFRRDKNTKAGGEWYRPYQKGGAKADFARKAFGKFLRSERS